jgi:hypothetical protein
VNKKISALLLTGFLILGFTSPAQAATDGGACTKTGVTTKIGKNNFICAKNPYNKPTKLTWVWDGCWELVNEFKEPQKENLLVIVNAEKQRVLFMAPTINLISDMLEWNALIPYLKNDIVFSKNNYYAAVKSNMNKPLTTANIGASKFWKVYNPTFLNSKVGKIPRPEIAIASADNMISSINIAGSKSTIESAKSAYSKLVSTIENKKSALMQVKSGMDAELIALDDAIDTASSGWLAVDLTIAMECKP